ncbi:MAG: hypothetical protein IH991_01695 [Planctomycetes bacterium]|nr:hypothetical protein [Planctomycetota bacterium]
MKRLIPFAFLASFVLALPAMIAADDKEEPAKKEPVKKEDPKQVKPRVQIKGQPRIRLVAPGLGVGRAANLNPINLLRNPKIKEEIKLTDEQETKIQEVNQKGQKKRAELIRKQQEATNQAIIETLKPEQRVRLEQLAVQQQGIRALSNPRIAKKLEISDEQSEKIAAAWIGLSNKQRQLFQDVTDGKVARDERAAKQKVIQEETEKEIMEILTMAQQTRFKQMQGKKFDFGRRIQLFRANGVIRLQIEARPLDRAKIKRVPKKQKD